MSAERFIERTGSEPIALSLIDQVMQVRASHSLGTSYLQGFVIAPMTDRDTAWVSAQEACSLREVINLLRGEEWAEREVMTELGVAAVTPPRVELIASEADLRRSMSASCVYILSERSVT